MNSYITASWLVTVSYQILELIRESYEAIGLIPESYIVRGKELKNS